jgi:hypothetical protein
MRASIIVGAGIGIFVAFAAQAQSSRQQPHPPPQSPPVVIFERTQPPIPPSRPVNPPRTYQDISPPMQGPTPLAPMAPRVGNGG